MSVRKSIDIPGFRHVNPIPNACMIGSLLMSGAIIGVDEEHKLPSGLQPQCRNMFGHVRAIVEAAGCTLDDIIKITVWLKDPADRVALNEEWLRLFPNPDSRPARHTLPHPGGIDALILCDIVAVRR